MRNAGLTLVVLGVIGCSLGNAGCSASDTGEPAPSTTATGPTRAEIEASDATPEEKSAGETLGARTGAVWSFREDPALHTAAFAAPTRGAGPKVLAGIRRASLALSANESLDVTRSTTAFLATHKDVLKLRAPADELVASRTTVDELAMTHVRLQQVERGVPVSGAEVYVHYDAEGRVTSLQQHYVPNLAALDVTASVALADAQATATQALAARLQAKTGLSVPVAPSGEARLVVDTHGATPMLAWQLDLTVGENGSWRASVDAHSGVVQSMLNRHQTLAGTGTGVLGTKRNIEFSTQNGQNVLVDTSRAAVIRTLDARQSADTNRARVVTSANANAWDTAAPLAPGAAVDSHFFIEVTTDFFAKTLNHKGWDGKGGEQKVFVHVGDDMDGQAGWDNAHYDPQANHIAVGDGRDFFKPLASAGDVLAHEFTHAVTGAFSNLEYINQSGALNESISDVFGAIVEHSVAPDPVKNWQLGEGLWKDGSSPALRDMNRPELGDQPSHMSQFVKLKIDEDNGGVHVNSGIPNKAAQLATVGGTHQVSKVLVAGPGIGFDKLAKVWHRANTTYLTTRSDFAAMAKATLQAASDLKLSETDINTIDCAWKAVGVAQGACVAPVIAPTNVDPVPDDAKADPAPTSADEEEDAPAETEKPAKKTTKKKTSTGGAETAAGCNATGSSSTSSDVGGLVLVAGLVVLARRRRPRA